jgi:hypothetical protein
MSGVSIGVKLFCGGLVTGASGGSDAEKSDRKYDSQIFHSTSKGNFSSDDERTQIVPHKKIGEQILLAIG